jgi:hypothetical protein
VGPRAGLDSEVKEKTLCPCRGVSLTTGINTAANETENVPERGDNYGGTCAWKYLLLHRYV